jgi:hypothetical protein
MGVRVLVFEILQLVVGQRHASVGQLFQLAHCGYRRVDRFGNLGCKSIVPGPLFTILSGTSGLLFVVAEECIDGRTEAIDRVVVVSNFR